MALAPVIAALAIGGGCVAHTVPTPSIPSVVLNGIAVSPDGDVWAVGEDKNLRGVAFHSTGGRFASIPLPPGTGDLRRVAALADDNAYAVALHGVLHWNGKRWQKTVLRDSYFGVSARTADDVWVVGTAGLANRVEHWDGTSWRRVRFLPIPAAHTTTLPHRTIVTLSSLDGVLARAPDDVWIVGSGIGKPIAAHWDGKKWTAYPVPIRDTHLGSLAATASGEVWASGNYYGGGSIAEWDGGRWIARADGYWAPDIVTRGDDVWTILDVDRVVRWTGTGWSPLQRKESNLYLKGLAVDAHGDIWAAGQLGNRSLVRVFRCR